MAKFKVREENLVKEINDLAEQVDDNTANAVKNKVEKEVRCPKCGGPMTRSNVGFGYLYLCDVNHCIGSRVIQGG